MSPKKILYSSDCSKAFTGFGKHAKVLLAFLFSRKNADGTPKYEIIEVAKKEVNDPILKSLPWKAYGTIDPNESLEGIPVNPDGSLQPQVLNIIQKLTGYGGFVIEKIMKEEKPFLSIHCEDPWAFSCIHRYSNYLNIGYWDTEWFSKSHQVLWSPLDSTPLYEPIVSNLSKIPHFWVKATFAERILHEKGFPNVEFMPFLLDIEKYRVFTPEEKLQVRNQYGLDEDTLIFSMVFRNQGRKRPLQILEALKNFQTNNPDRKAKALFVTNPFDEGGWTFPGPMKDLGLDSNDVIFAYICHTCDSSSLKPFSQEPIHCENCGTHNSCRPISITKGISEDDLLKVYNITDGYIQAAHSGGFEGPCGESVFAGTPLATVDYAYGETFVRTGEVFPLKYIIDREMGSNFEKAHIPSSSILEFMQKIADDPEEMKQKALRAREWAMKTIHPKIILDKIEKFIDSLPENDYSWDFCMEYPNIEASFPEEAENAEWIKKLVKGFFNDNISETHKDYIALLDQLEKGADRKEVFEYFKNLAQKRKEDMRGLDIEQFIKKTPNKKLVYEVSGAAECYLSLTILERIALLYPEYEIYISTDHPDIFSHLECNVIPHFVKPEPWWRERGITLLSPKGVNTAVFQEFHKFSSNYKSI